MTEFGPSEVHLGEAFVRIQAHHRLAGELYERDRRADALFQATRPITEILPWLQNEIRGGPDLARTLTAALAHSGSEIRHGASKVRVRKSLRAVADLCDRALEGLVGKAAQSPRYIASVAGALLLRAETRYEDALSSGLLGDYQEAHALIRAGTEIYRRLAGQGGGGASNGLNGLEVLERAAGLPDPPASPFDTDALRAAAEQVRRALTDRFGALADLTEEPAGRLKRVGRLLGDIGEAYERDDVALAARLAATTFVRVYDPAIEDLRDVAPDVERELTETLGRALRLAIDRHLPHEQVQEILKRLDALLGMGLEALFRCEAQRRRVPVPEGTKEWQ